jgi:hypothetical protein
MEERIMKYLRTILVIAIAAALTVGCDDSGPTGLEPGAEEFDWSGVVASGERIEIKNISGNVHASFTSGNEVLVHTTKTGRDSDPASVTIEVVRHAEGVTICAVYPDVPGHAPNECLPGLQGNISTRDNDVKVEFTLRVPAGVQFVARVLGGDVVADGLESDVFANTTGGDVTVTTTGISEASSVYGSLNVTIGQADPGRDLAFRTVNGNVTVRVPANTNAGVLATTTYGAIASEFQLEGTRYIRTGTLGIGGPRLTLSTIDGNVNLREGPAVQP